MLSILKGPHSFLGPPSNCSDRGSGLFQWIFLVWDPLGQPLMFPVSQDSLLRTPWRRLHFTDPESNSERQDLHSSFSCEKRVKKGLACPISASLPLQPQSFSNDGPCGFCHPSIPHHHHTRQPLLVKSNETTPPFLLLYPSISYSGISVRLEQWDFLPCAVFLFPCSSLLLGSGLPIPQKVSTWCLSSTPILCVCFIAWVTWFSFSWFAVEALKAIAEYWDLKSWNFTATDPCDGNAPWSAETANPRLACDCTIYPNNTCHVTHLWLLLLLVLIFINDWIPKLNCVVLEWQQGICFGCIGWNPGGIVPIDGAYGLVSYCYICSLVFLFAFSWSDFGFSYEIEACMWCRNLGQNVLSGPIPAEIGRLEKMRYL